MEKMNHPPETAANVFFYPSAIETFQELKSSKVDANFGVKHGSMLNRFSHV